MDTQSKQVINKIHNIEFLKQRLNQDKILVAPGIYDALSAMLAEQAGFETVFLSGASLAYTRFGLPDIGLISMKEVADTVAAITDKIKIPLIVDADDGYGNALNVERTVRTFERMGASVIMLEDQQAPKRCGHLAGKHLITPDAMVGKIKAALDSRHSDETLIMARTDAIAVEGIDAALERGEKYLAANADILFIEAPTTLTMIEQIAKSFGGRIPIVANMPYGGITPQLSAFELEKMGFSIVYFGGCLVRAFMKMADNFFTGLKHDGSTQAFWQSMLTQSELNNRLGTDDFFKRDKNYSL